MKKRCQFILLLLACTTLLCACNLAPAKLVDATTAEQALQNMDTQMAALQSYRADVTMDFVLYADSTKWRGELISIVIEDAGEGLGNYYSYTEIRNTMYVNGSFSPSVKVYSIDAYCDGYGYQSYTCNDQRRKLRSKMRASEFIKYREGDSDIIDFDYVDCQNTTFEATDKETTNTSQVDVSATFSNTKEGFSFKADMADNDVGRTVTYGNGDMIGLDAPDGTKINRMTDAQAKAEMLSWINDPTTGYEYTRVLNIEKTKTGYVVTMIPADNSIVDQISDAINVSLHEELETIEFVFKWGKLVKLIHSFEGSAELYGEKLTYAGSITVTFE